MTPEDKKTMLANLNAETQAQYERAVFPVEVARDKDGDVPIDTDGDVGVCLGLDHDEGALYINYTHRHVSHYCRPFREYWQNLYADADNISFGLFWGTAEEAIEGAKRPVRRHDSTLAGRIHVIVQNEGDEAVITQVAL